MADEGAVGVIEAPVVETPEISTGEPSSAIAKPEPGTKEANNQPDDKLDGRKQPDAFKKYISELRRAAELELDPAVKTEKLAHAKRLFDTVGKAGAYEEQFKTVREVREVKALLDTIGAEHNGDWKIGIQQMQSKIGEARQIDQQLESGDPAVVKKIWDEAPEGVPKIMPALLDKFAESKPADYEKVITPHALNIIEKAGFIASLNGIYEALKAGDGPSILKIVNGMKGWFEGNKQAVAAKPQPDPEVERLRGELNKTREKETTQANEQALTAVENHSLPVLEGKLKAIVGKLGLSQEQLTALTRHAWNDLTESRNKDGVYQTVAMSKYQQGAAVWTTYAKQWTDDNAEVSARKAANLYYGHQLRNGAVKAAPDPTKPVAAKPGTVTLAQQPSTAEIDYGPNGKAAARRLGYNDLRDMLLDHKAPLKSGGVGAWK